MTIVNNEKDAVEYAVAMLKLEYSKPFKAWCYWAKKEFTDPAAWGEYMQTALPKEGLQKYLVKQLHYEFKDIVALIRMFGGCLPLGCSFNTDSEIEFFKEDIENMMKEESKHE